MRKHTLTISPVNGPLSNRFQKKRRRDFARVPTEDRTAKTVMTVLYRILERQPGAEATKGER